MPLGRLQLQRISLPGQSPETYQVRHEAVDGGLFVGSVEKNHLGEFLHQSLRLDSEVVEGLLDELHLRGHAFIPEVSIAYSDLAGSGLEHLPEQR